MHLLVLRMVFGSTSEPMEMPRPDRCMLLRIVMLRDGRPTVRPAASSPLLMAIWSSPHCDRSGRDAAFMYQHHHVQLCTWSQTHALCR